MSCAATFGESFSMKATGPSNVWLKTAKTQCVNWHAVYIYIHSKSHEWIRLWGYRQRVHCIADCIHVHVYNIVCCANEALGAKGMSSVFVIPFLFLLYLVLLIAIVSDKVNLEMWLLYAFGFFGKLSIFLCSWSSYLWLSLWEGMLWFTLVPAKNSHLKVHVAVEELL